MIASARFRSFPGGVRYDGDMTKPARRLAAFAAPPLALLALAGCTTLQPTAAADANGEPVPTRGSGPTAQAADSSPQAGATEAPSSQAAKSAVDCKAIKPAEIEATIENEPGKGTCLNNAQTSKEAGSSDRCVGVADVIKASRDGFRCCYDVYTRSHPNPGANVVLHVELKPDGTVTSTSIDKERSDLADPELESCMADIVSTMQFPASPSGKETKFNYPFGFKAHSKGKVAN